MTEDHGSCEKCDFDFNGEYIWRHFYDKFMQDGFWLDEEGNYITELRKLSAVEAAEQADKTAESYGATREKGRFGKQIGIYDMAKDRTVAWRCPSCEQERPR